MRDLVFLGWIGALLAMGFKRPFLFVLAFIYIDILQPQRLTYGLLEPLQLSLVTFLLAVGGWILADDKRGSRFGPRQGMILVLLLYCWMTTINADFPVDAAAKWAWVWKALVFAIFLPLTLKTRLRLEATSLFLCLSAGTIIIVGGIKTLASGGGYGALNLMVTNNSGIYESSIISLVAIAIIPLILFLMNHGTLYPPEWRVRIFCGALIFSCLLIPIGTEARTGLICAAILAVMLLRQAKRPLMWITAAALMGMAAIPFLPSSFTNRMDTIKEYKADTSASTRIAVWKWTLDYVALHPFGGGFDAYKQNSLRYEAAGSDKPREGEAAAPAPTDGKPVVVVDAARAYHSSYFEMLGEQGYPGLIWWLTIHLIGLVRMEVLYRRYRKSGDAADIWVSKFALALQQAQIVILAGSTFVGIAFQPFVWIIIAMQIGLDSYAARRASLAAYRPILPPAEPRLAPAH